MWPSRTAGYTCNKLFRSVSRVFLSTLNRLTSSHIRPSHKLTLHYYQAPARTASVNANVKAHKERRNWTKLNWPRLVFDELTSGQAVRHFYSNSQTASLTTLSHASTHDQRARRACLLVSSSKTKPYQFSSLTSLCTRLNTRHC